MFATLKKMCLCEEAIVEKKKKQTKKKKKVNLILKGIVTLKKRHIYKGKTGVPVLSPLCHVQAKANIHKTACSQILDRYYVPKTVWT